MERYRERILIRLGAEAPAATATSADGVFAPSEG